MILQISGDEKCIQTIAEQHPQLGLLPPQSYDPESGLWWINCLIGEQGWVPFEGDPIQTVTAYLEQQADTIRNLRNIQGIHGQTLYIKLIVPEDWPYWQIRLGTKLIRIANELGLDIAFAFNRGITVPFGL
jgi:hypothetical protein